MFATLGFFGFKLVGSRSLFIAKSNSSSEASTSQTGFLDFRLFLGLSSSLPRDYCPKMDTLVSMSCAKISWPKPPGGTGDKTQVRTFSQICVQHDPGRYRGTQFANQ